MTGRAAQVVRWLRRGGSRARVVQSSKSPARSVDYSAQEDWDGRVQGLLIALAEVAPQVPLVEVQHLVDHGESPHALLSLAWAISNARTSVPRWVIEFIRDSVDGWYESDELPPDLDDYAV